MCKCSLQLLIEPWICAPGTTHYDRYDRGSVEYEVCPTLLHITTTGNPTTHLLIMNPNQCPLGHVLSGIYITRKRSAYPFCFCSQPRQCARGIQSLQPTLSHMTTTGKPTQTINFDIESNALSTWPCAQWHTSSEQNRLTLSGLAHKTIALSEQSHRAG